MEVNQNIADQNSPAILVVDDDVPFVEYVSEMLDGEGYRVCKAFGGEEGVTEFVQHQPQLIITDIVMPAKDGLELIMAARKQDSEIPIIAVSGGNSGFGSDYLMAAKKFGANVVPKKPFHSEMLLDTAEELLSAA